MMCVCVASQKGQKGAQQSEYTPAGTDVVADTRMQQQAGNKPKKMLIPSGNPLGALGEKHSAVVGNG